MCVYYTYSFRKKTKLSWDTTSVAAFGGVDVQTKKKFFEPKKARGRYGVCDSSV